MLRGPAPVHRRAVQRSERVVIRIGLRRRVWRLSSREQQQRENTHTLCHASRSAKPRKGERERTETS